MTTPTDPLDGLRLPYAVTAQLEVDKDSFSILPQHQNYDGSYVAYRLAVPEGASMVSASYDGPEQVTVELTRLGLVRRTLFTIPEKSGGGGALRDHGPNRRDKRQRLHLSQNPRFGHPGAGRLRPRPVHQRLPNPTSYVAALGVV